MGVYNVKEIEGKDIKVIGSGSNSITTSNKTITLLKSLLVTANTFKSSLTKKDAVKVRVLFRKGTVNSSTYTVYLYWNTASTLNGSQIQIATYDVPGTTPSPQIVRTFRFRSNDTIDILDTTFSATLDIGDLAATLSNPAVSASVDGYFIVAAKCTGINRTEDQITCSYITIEV